MTELWWQHHQALQANGRTAAAQRALALAYRFLVEPISKLTDEGLRRNYLNKVDVHRKIVEATLAGRRRSAGSRRPPAHLAVTSSLQEPFERLVDTGLRMNALRSRDELQEFLIDEATEISGAERVLLILETSAGPQLAGSLVPKGEDASKAHAGRRAGACRRRAHADREPRARPRRRAGPRTAFAHRRAADRARHADGLPVRGPRRRVRPLPRRRPRPARDAGEPGGGRARQRAVVAGARAEGRRAHGRAAGVQRADRAARQRARDHQQHPGGHGGRARLPGDRRPRRATSCARCSQRATCRSGG